MDPIGNLNKQSLNIHQISPPISYNITIQFNHNHKKTYCFKLVEVKDEVSNKQ